jgi:integrase
MRVLSVAQVVALLKAAKGTRFEALYVLAVTTGLRQGELLGLQWEDIDFTGAKAHIRHGLQQLGDRRWLAEPKTARARRVVNLPAMAVAALRSHRRHMLAEGHPHGLVFCDTRGGSVRKSNLVRRSFKPILERAELPPIRFHDLRHTAATLLFKQGVHPRVVQELLGHAQIAVTLDTYSHVLPSMGRAAVEKIDNLLGHAKAKRRL